METNGKSFMSISVYKFPLGDCTLNGLSSKVDTTLMMEMPSGPNRGPFSGEKAKELIEEYGGDYLVLTEGPFGNPRLVPAKLLAEGKWVMPGGNFGYCSDSRFPSKQPIAIFDRVER